jgi:hypothetical protein
VLAGAEHLKQPLASCYDLRTKCGWVIFALSRLFAMQALQLKALVGDDWSLGAITQFFLAEGIGVLPNMDKAQPHR